MILINEENSDDDDGDLRTVALVESHGRSWVEQTSIPLFSKVPDLLTDSQIQSLTLILAPLICRSGPSVLLAVQDSSIGDLVTHSVRDF